LSLAKLLAVLTALLLALLLFIVSVEVIFPSSVEGELTYVRTAGEAVTEIIVYIPLYEKYSKCPRWWLPPPEGRSGRSLRVLKE